MCPQTPTQYIDNHHQMEAIMAVANPAAPRRQARPQQQGGFWNWAKKNWMGILFVTIFAAVFAHLAITAMNKPSKAEVAEMIGKQHADTVKEMKEYMAESMDTERKQLVKNYGLTLGGQPVAQQPTAQPVVIACPGACPVPAAAAPKRVTAAVTPQAPDGNAATLRAIAEDLAKLKASRGGAHMHRQTETSAKVHVCNMSINGQIVETIMTEDDAACKIWADEKAKGKGLLPRKS